MYFWMIGQYCAVQWLVHQQSALHHCAVFSLPICYTVIAPQMCYDWSTGLLLSDWSIDVILIDWSTSVLLCDWSIDVKLTDWFTSVLLSDWSIFVQHSDGSTSATFACHNSKQHLQWETSSCLWTNKQKGPQISVLPWQTLQVEDWKSGQPNVLPATFNLPFNRIAFSWTVLHFLTRPMSCMSMGTCDRFVYTS